MMMRAMHDGGLQCLVQIDQEKLNTGEDYIPNPDGLWEVGQTYYTSPKFLRLMQDGDCVKILFDGLASIPKGEYKVIFMHRHVDEINLSIERVDKHLRSQGIPENKMMLRPFDVFRPYNQDDIDHVLGICEARSDIELIQVQYRDVIENPIMVFEGLKKRGIPINVEKSAAIVNQNYYRSRKIHDSNDTSRSSRVRTESIGNEQSAAQEKR
jgi:hypothetical protein